MKDVIKIIPAIIEKNLSSIHLTKSKEGKTATVSLLFIKPKIFTQIDTITLIYKEKQVSSNEITFLFKKGKPFILKAIFLFTEKDNYFFFLKFLRLCMTESHFFYSLT